ncbi:TlpA family protein disulfide reductase [Pedobacter xixiisoli]|nr:TlpA disulfide reductase family protein [Pedobacter xixiisoli]
MAILIAIPIYAGCSSIPTIPGKNGFEISVTNHDLNATALKDFVQLTVHEFFSNFDFIINAQTIKMSLGYESKDSWKIKLPSRFAYLNISYRKSGRSQSFFKYRYTYLIAEGDRLQCEIFKDFVRFTGDGSAKMNLQAQLFHLMETPIDSTVPFEEYIVARNDIYLRQLDLLDDNKKLISTDELAYLRDQCYGLRNWDILRLLRFRLKFRKDDKSFQTKDVLAWLEAGDAKYISTQDIVAPYLMDYLYQKEKFTTELSVNGKQLARKLLENITSKFEPRISYHLKMLMLTHFYSYNEEVLQDFKETTPVVDDRQYAAIFKHFDSSFSKGKRAYDFAYPDTSGRINRLDDFKGKIVVIDFWFVGCIPCLELAKQMKKIGHGLKGRDVVFITANVDQNQAKWKNAVKEGNYTHQGTINLFLGGMKSPILRHYNITAYPRLIIIDKHGLIVTSTPVVPIDEASRANFIDIIEQHLSK